MEILVRGYVNKKDGGQESYYFENTIKNIANFIISHEDETSEIVVENIFGKPLLKTSGIEGVLEGVRDCLSQIDKYLFQLRNKEVKIEKVSYLDIHDINNKDEFDSKYIMEKEFENLCECYEDGYI